MERDTSNEIIGFLDKEGKLEIWPAKPVKKLAVLKFLASKFQFDKDYTEKEVNAIIKEHASYSDYVLLRRELFGSKLLNRTLDGRSYWRIKED